MILSDKNGFDTHSYPITWISSKKEARLLAYVLVPSSIIFTAVMYFFQSFQSTLVMIGFDAVLASILLLYLAFGKEKRYTLIPVRTEERGKDEYKKVYWKLIRILKGILERGGFRYEKVDEWPKTTYRVVDKEYEVSFRPADRLGEVYCYALVIGPVTSDNYLYVEILQKSISHSFIEEGLIEPRKRKSWRS